MPYHRPLDEGQALHSRPPRPSSRFAWTTTLLGGGLIALFTIIVNTFSPASFAETFLLSGRDMAEVVVFGILTIGIISAIIAIIAWIIFWKKWVAFRRTTFLE